MAGEPWPGRVDRAMRVRQLHATYREADVVDGETAHGVIGSLDQRAGVGARHHVVPRFLLDRWADRRGQVQVYSRVDKKLGLRNVRDLAIRDFYTFVDIHDQQNSLLESVLGRVESVVAVVLKNIQSAFIKDADIDADDLATLALFTAFQVVRTPRHRKESELHADWYAKTMMRGQVSEEELTKLTVVPHQNELVSRLGSMADELAPYLLARPLTLINLDRPRLLVSDEPVVVNVGPGQVHHPDCFLSDEDIQSRIAKERRKKKRRQREVSRIVHFWSPVPRGLGTALEVVLPISPRSALVWGPLSDDGDVGVFEREKFTESESELFAQRVNDALCAQALDWIISTPDDTAFADRSFPELGPLLRVCDGTNAASAAINSTPALMRPRRLAKG